MITFIELIISIANILSLWHGTSFISLLHSIYKYIEIYINRVNRKLMIIYNQSFIRHLSSIFLKIKLMIIKNKLIHMAK